MEQMTKQQQKATKSGDKQVKALHFWEFVGKHEQNLDVNYKHSYTAKSK